MMRRYVVKRLFVAVPSLLIASLIVFTLPRLIPGDVVQLMLEEKAYGKDLEDLRAKLGLNRPIPVQYVEWLGAIARGNLGESLWTRKPVIEELGRRLPVTATLGLLATTNTVRVGLYHRALAPTPLLVPDDAGQERIMDAIMAVKASRDRSGLAEACLLEAGRLVERGAEGIVYGCTELSVLLGDHVLPVPVLDPLEMLAERIVHAAEPVTTS